MSRAASVAVERAEELDFALAGRADTGNAVEHGALAGAVRADQGHHLAGPDSQRELVVGDQAAETLGHVGGREEEGAGCGRRPFGQQFRLRNRTRLRTRRPQFQDHRPQPVARALQDQHHGDAEDDDLEIAALPEYLRQQILQPLLEDGDQPGPENRAPDVADAADDGHEQVLDTLRQGERRRIDEALQVSVEPAGNARQQRRDEENDDLGARRVDAHRLGHHRPALESADRATLARIEQVADGQDGEQHDDPDQVIKLATRLEFPAEQRHRRNAGNAGVAAEEFDVAEQEIQADAPGDGTQRQVMATHAQRDEAEAERHRAGDGEADEQRDPGRKSVRRGQPRRRVGAETDKGRLAEGSQAADAGQQHQTDDDNRVEADVVEQRDRELRQHQRAGSQRRNENGQR